MYLCYTALSPVVISWLRGTPPVRRKAGQGLIACPCTIVQPTVAGYGSRAAWNRDEQPVGGEFVEREEKEKSEEGRECAKRNFRETAVTRRVLH